MSAAAPDRIDEDAGRAIFPHRHLLGIAGLAPRELLFLLDEASNG